MTPSLPVDPCRCPLCGEPNACAMACAAPAKAPGTAPEPCWCTLEKFSAKLLAQVPASARNKACICAACVKASQDAA